MARFAPRPCLHIGITGGIGSGKSTAAAILQAATDASLIDADQLARASTRADGAAMAQIRATFGDAVIAADGSMLRDVMREWAFRDPAIKRKLEAIIHPIVLQQAWPWRPRQSAKAKTSSCTNCPCWSNPPIGAKDCTASSW